MPLLTCPILRIPFATFYKNPLVQSFVLSAVEDGECGRNAVFLLAKVVSSFQYLLKLFYRALMKETITVKRFIFFSFQRCLGTYDGSRSLFYIFTVCFKHVSYGLHEAHNKSFNLCIYVYTYFLNTCSVWATVFTGFRLLRCSNMPKEINVFGLI